MTNTDRILPGVALMLTFCVIAPLIDVASKFAAQSVSPGVVTLGRYIVQGSMMLPVVLLMRLSLRMSARAMWLNFWRSVAGIASTMTFVAAVKVMPIADALAIAFVEPFIILLIGRLVLGEQVGPRRLGAAAVGFVGVLFVIQPSFAVFGAVALFPLGTAVAFAFYILITRALSREMHPVAMQFQTAWVAGLICLPLLALGTKLEIPAITWSLPQGSVLFWCVAMGAATTISHMAITMALKFAPSSTLAPLHYLEIVTATLFGYVFFGDFPNALTWLGIAIIVASGLYIIHRERITARETRLSAALPPV